MKLAAMVTVMLLSFCAFAAESTKTIPFNHKKAEIVSVIESYSKTSGKKFIIEAGVAGTLTIVNPTPVTPDEAFNQLCASLAMNGFAIFKVGENYHVRPARSAQRDMIETGSEVPAVAPMRMYTWIFSPKYVSAEQISKDIRGLTSKDGEIYPYPPKNQLIITDWSSSINRIAKVLTDLDTKAEKK